MEQEKITRRQFLKAITPWATGVLLAGCSQNAASEFPQPSPNPTSTEVETPPQISVSPGPNPTPEPSATPDTRSYFERYLYPALLSVTETRRNQKGELDPSYWHRVDRELNEQRINFALLGRGSEQLHADSIQILSLNTQGNEVRVLSIHRDTEAPEISRMRGVERPYRINQTHQIGGMPLMETVLEDMTGLSADYVFFMDMSVLPDAVSELFGNQLEVCIPWEINDMMMGYFPSGLHTLNGERILRLSRARYYADNPQRNTVQQYVLRAILGRARQELSEGLVSAASFTARSLIFFRDKVSEGKILVNFDQNILLQLGGELVTQISQGKIEPAQGFGMPAFAARYELTTENAGDPVDIHRRIPTGGDRSAEDLVTGYWNSTRRQTAEFLTSEVSGFELENSVCAQVE